LLIENILLKKSQQKKFFDQKYFHRKNASDYFLSIQKVFFFTLGVFTA